MADSDNDTRGDDESMSTAARISMEKRLNTRRGPEPPGEALAELKAVSTLDSHAIRWMNKRKKGIQQGAANVKVNDCSYQIYFLSGVI